MKSARARVGIAIVGAWLGACSSRQPRPAVELGAPAFTYSRAPGPTPPAWAARPPSASKLSSGRACRKRLEQLGVPFRRLKSKRGLAEPVEITGPISGVVFRRGRTTSAIGDCKLSLALFEVARVLRRWGVVEVQHYGAYSYRSTRSGRLSLHARGLAIDLRAFTFRAPDGSTTTRHVKNDFERGLGDGCSRRFPVLNQLYCQLYALGLFREFITPEHDRDHHDHFHLGLPRQ